MIKDKPAPTSTVTTSTSKTRRFELWAKLGLGDLSHEPSPQKKIETCLVKPYSVSYLWDNGTSGTRYRKKNKKNGVVNAGMSKCF